MASISFDLVPLSRSDILLYVHPVNAKVGCQQNQAACGENPAYLS